MENSSSEPIKLCGNSLAFGQSVEFGERARVSKSVRKFTKQVQPETSRGGCRLKCEKQLSNGVRLKVGFSKEEIM